MSGRGILIAIGTVIVIIILSILIFSIDWGGPKQQAANIIKQKNITELANSGTVVRMSVRGPINNNQEHEELRITVGQTSATGEYIQGYQSNVTRTQQTPNNPQSYQGFLSALSNANFTKTQLPKDNVQYDGACSAGTRYTFEFIGNDPDLPGSSWATSCGKKEGTFAGDLSAVKKLFQAQLPKDQFNSLTQNTIF